MSTLEVNNKGMIEKGTLLKHFDEELEKYLYDQQLLKYWQ